jgi:hypothetical protein
MMFLPPPSVNTNYYTSLPPAPSMAMPYSEAGQAVLMSNSAPMTPSAVAPYPDTASKFTPATESTATTAPPQKLYTQNQPLQDQTLMNQLKQDAQDLEKTATNHLHHRHKKPRPDASENTQINALSTPVSVEKEDVDAITPTVLEGEEHKRQGPLASLARVITASAKGGLKGSILGVGLTTPLLLIKPLRTPIVILGTPIRGWPIFATLSGTFGALLGGSLGAIGQSLREMVANFSTRRNDI